MFELRDILRQSRPDGVPEGSPTEPGTSGSMDVLDDAAAGGGIKFNTDAPVVSIPGSPAPAPAPPPPGQLPTMTEDGVITQPAAAAAPPAATTAEMLAQGPASDFRYGTELNEDGLPVAVTPERHQFMTDAGHYLNPTTGQWVKGTPTAAPGQRRGRGAPAARLTQTTTASPHMTSLMYATKERGESLAALADAQADQDEATAVIYGEMADELQSEAERLGQMRQQAIQQAQESSARLQAQADELGATEPQVGRLFGTGGQAAAMGAALSIAAGAMLSVRRGGNNVALSIVQKAIDRDMAAQKLAIQNKQYALRAGLDIAQQMQAAYRDDLTASKAIQATLEKYAVNRLEAITRASNRPLLEAKAQAGIADLNLKFMATLEEVTREKYQLNIAGPTARLQNIVASAMGQTLPPMLKPQDADPALTQDAAITTGKVKKGQSNEARTRSQNARNQGRKIRKDATPTPAEKYPGWAQQTVQGRTIYTPMAGGDRQPTSPAIPVQGGYYTNTMQGVPPGWTLQHTTGRGPYKYIVTRSENVTPADPAKLAEAMKGGSLYVPVPKSGPGQEPLRGLAGLAKKGKGTVLWVDPQDYGSPKAAQEAVNKVRAFAIEYSQFVSLYNQAKKLSEKQRTWFAQGAGKTLADQAAGAVTRMAGGGVMGEGEYKRASETIKDPEDEELWQKWIVGKSTAEERGMAGWDQLMKIVTGWRNAGYERLSNGGISTTTPLPANPGAASSPVQSQRPGS